MLLSLAGTHRGFSAGRWFPSRQREREEPRLGRARRALLVERERLGPLVVEQQRPLMGRRSEARPRPEGDAHAAAPQVAQEVNAQECRCAGGKLASVRARRRPFAWRKEPPISTRGGGVWIEVQFPMVQMLGAAQHIAYRPSRARAMQAVEAKRMAHLGIGLRPQEAFCVAEQLSATFGPPARFASCSRAAPARGAAGDSRVCFASRAASAQR